MDAKEQWDESHRTPGLLRQINEAIPEIVGRFRNNGVIRVLDLGCGSGRHTVYLAEQGFDVYGLDISEEAIRNTKQQLGEKGLSADLVVGSIYAPLPYPDDFFDAVICIRVINHAEIGDIRRAISEIKRVLRVKGILFITARKEVPRERRVRVKIIGPRLFVPLEGVQQGVIHYQFSKRILRKEFEGFKIYDIWVDSERCYCLLGELKGDKIHGAICCTG
jgi:ubiquinone/menaquinone biosynthesis C-methylase UbiE